MPWITISRLPFASIETLDALRHQPGAEPDVLRASYAGPAADGLRVIDIWESKAEATHFFDHVLGPVLAQALGPEPVGFAELVGIDVQRTYRRNDAGDP